MPLKVERVNKVGAVAVMEFPENRVLSTDALSGGVLWVGNLLLGSAGTIVAVLAIAVVGVLMLSGRMPFRRGGTVVIGCFVLFSAPAISNGILSGIGPAQPATISIREEAQPYTPTRPKFVAVDPYAGAAVPNQR